LLRWKLEVGGVVGAVEACCLINDAIDIPSKVTATINLAAVVRFGVELVEVGVVSDVERNVVKVEWWVNLRKWKVAEEDEVVACARCRTGREC
jgi:hypothetical protein